MTSAGHSGGQVAFNEERGRWLWRCSGCGKQDFWGQGWTWFGCWADRTRAHLQHVEWVACSDECKAKGPKGPEIEE